MNIVEIKSNIKRILRKKKENNLNFFLYQNNKKNLWLYN